jgi:sugar phosphate isomerase/epimerase
MFGQLFNYPVMTQNRRQFIATTAMAGASIPFGTSLVSNLVSGKEKGFGVRLFSKPLDRYETTFMCECIMEAGIGGIDLTVRAGGKIEPASVETLLPQFVEKAVRYGIKTDMMVTGILSASDPFTERILKTASSLGISHYRPGWMTYDLKSGVRESIAKFRSSLSDIDKLNRKYNISLSYQNHSGTTIGGPVWDLDELMRDFSPEFTGIQYDVRHAMIEGAGSWPLGLNLVAPHINTLAIKDFTWKSINGKPQVENVPLGEGVVDWDLYFTTVKSLKISVPVTLHVEYPLLEKGEENLSLPEQKSIIVRKLKKDYDFLTSNLLRYGLT